MDWSRSLHPWQRDALRRVLVGRVVDDDITELAILAKAAHGMALPTGLGIEVAAAKHIPLQPENGDPVLLLRVREIVNVNALSSGPISFGAAGLTIIYGDSGSGKSGIARILKKVGRARDPGGPILPNVLGPGPFGESASANAIIDFRVGEVEKSFHWRDGFRTHEALSGINVFDSDCAAVQIERNNNLTFTPDILRVFQELAETCHAVNLKLKTEKETIDSSREAELALLSLGPGTKAGNLLARLSKDTLSKDIEALCQIEQEEHDLMRQLRQALRDSPGEQANLLQGRVGRLRHLSGSTKGIEEILCDSAVENFETDLANSTSSKKIAEAARNGFVSNSALEGIGAGEWKALWESARRYSEQVAYPAQEFPFTSGSALCVLCQQPIGDNASLRLRRFEDFVRSDAQQKANADQTRLQSSANRIANLEVPHSTVAQRETLLLGTQSGEQIKQFLILAKLRRRYLLRIARGKAARKPQQSLVLPDLNAVTRSVEAEIVQLRDAAQSQSRHRMEMDLKELEDRAKIAPMKDKLKREVARLKFIAILEAGRADCDTSRITRKAGEVAKLVVTARLRNAFSQNLSDLGSAAPPVEVKIGQGVTGQHPYRLSLIAREDVLPAEVLSDGEKTCIALAGFLAELEATDNRSGIVLEDPVSSLDHNYRLRVARRLVDAAKNRQVVVFTHDVVFLVLLTRYGTKAGVGLKECSLQRGGPQHGLFEENPPWVAMPVNKRIGVMRKELQSATAILAKDNRRMYEEKAESIYRKLRQSWERAVEEVLLNSVVMRFSDGIQTQWLKLLSDISDADIQTIDAEMSNCSSFLHDEAEAVNAGMPEPSVLEADIKKLESWVADIRKRRK